MLQIIEFTLNGQPCELAVDQRWSLADALRRGCNLTSIKKGCEVGECGACTVLVDGQAIDSCLCLALWAAGKSVTTVEGLKSGQNDLHPIQQAFVDECAVQCGFCTPGLIMSAVEILGSGKTYSRDQLRKLISGHLCRCTGYENIVNALERACRERDNAK